MAVRFKDGDSFDFDLSNEGDCKFLFGDTAQEVYNLSKVKGPVIRAKISRVDIETNTIYLEPSDGR